MIYNTKNRKNDKVRKKKRPVLMLMQEENLLSNV